VPSKRQPDASRVNGLHAGTQGIHFPGALQSERFAAITGHSLSKTFEKQSVSQWLALCPLLLNHASALSSFGSSSKSSSLGGILLSALTLFRPGVPKVPLPLSGDWPPSRAGERGLLQPRLTMLSRFEGP